MKGWKIQIKNFFGIDILSVGGSFVIRYNQIYY